jgi:photosystem II stability/assembly factor-like uncharacterized protein
MLSLIAALVLGLVPLQDQGSRIPQKPPLTPEEEISRHFARRKGMNTAERLAGYEKRRQMEQDSDFSKLVWRSVGSEHHGGRVVRILSPKGKPEQLLVAYATGGLWRTEDTGITWTPLFEGQSSFGIGDFGISADGQTIWVGTGEANSQRTSYQGTGVFKSVDGGKTWQNMGLHDTNHIGRLILHPKDPNTVYVAALGHLYSDNEERGVFKTSDGGKTWTHSLKINDQTGVVDLAMDPRNPDVLFATAWERERRAWDFRDAGRATAVYRTANGGKTWEKLGGGLPTGQIGRIGIAIAESKPDTVYAFVDNWNPDPEAEFEDEFAPSRQLTLRRFRMLDESMFAALTRQQLAGFVARYFPQGTNPEELQQQVKDGKLKMAELVALMEKRDPDVMRMERVEHEIYRSDDGGKTWKRTHAYRFGNHGGYYWGKVRVHPQNPDELFTLGVLALRSKDGGKTWKREGQGVHVDFHDLWYDPNKPGRFIFGCDGGVYESGDDGKTFRHLNNVPVGQYTTIAVDMKTPYNIYGGLQDNGTQKGPSTYVPGRSPLHQWSSVGGGDGSWVAVDPRDGGDLIYIASQFGAHTAFNQKTGERWPARASAGRGEEELRYNWVSPLIVSPHHPDILYLGSQKVHRSFNQGRTWQDISPDITKNRKPIGDVPFSTLKALDESPLKFGLIYAGADDGSVKMTPDGGNTWVDIATPAPDKWVSRVLASKWDVDTVYCTQSGYRDDDYRPYVWKSTNRGKTWTSIAGNLPEGFVNVIREDPVRPNILYLGTGLGAFVSFDGGARWEPLHAGMPRVAVHDLAIHPRELDLVAGTHGRSVFVLNLRPLHALTPDIRQKDLFVFPMADMPHNPQWAFARKPNWDASPTEHPKAKGWLWAKAPGKATLTIRDKDGKALIVRELETAKGLQPFEADLLLEPGKPSGGEKDRRPKTLEEVLADPRAAERPKYLGVGSYTIEISMDGKSASTPWKLVEPASPQGGPGRRGGEG